MCNRRSQKQRREEVGASERDYAPMQKYSERYSQMATNATKGGGKELYAR